MMPSLLVTALALAVVSALHADQSTVDPRLAEPLRLLRDARVSSGEPIGREYALIVEGSQPRLIVEPMRPGLAGRYHVPSRTVAIAEAALAEDPRFVAAALAHELKHVDDADLVSLGLLEPDCLELEARGFAAQATIARAFWPDELPHGTDFERELAALVRLHDREGIDGIRTHLARESAYLEACGTSRRGSGETAAATGRQRPDARDRG
jgi:hypothetical protein